MTVHRTALQTLDADAWTGLTLKAMLLHEASTAAPAAGDQFVADLMPGSNELVNDDYDRVTLTGLAVTWNSTAEVYELEADDVDFGELTPADVDQGVKGWAVYAHVTDDDDSWLVRSYEGSPIALNGDHVRISWADGILLTIEGG